MKYSRNGISLGATSILWSETMANTICTVLIFRGIWSSVANIQKITVGKWLRSIERGFAQAENNHFKPLIRGVPRAIDHVTNR